MERCGRNIVWTDTEEAMYVTKDRVCWRSFIRTYRRQMAGVRNWWICNL